MVFSRPYNIKLVSVQAQPVPNLQQELAAGTESSPVNHRVLTTEPTLHLLSDSGGTGNSGATGNATNQAHLLLQSNCGLQFGNQVLSFSSCQNITSQLGTDYNLLWTVASDGNGNSTFRGAIDAAASSQIKWAGFGFAVPGTMQMLGGSALIVKECQTCSSGESRGEHITLEPPSHHSPALKGGGKATLEPPSHHSPALRGNGQVFKVTSAGAWLDDCYLANYSSLHPIPHWHLKEMAKSSDLPLQARRLTTTTWPTTCPPLSSHPVT